MSATLHCQSYRSEISSRSIAQSNQHFCIPSATTELKHGPKRQRVRAAATIKKAMPAYLSPNRSQVDAKQRNAMRVFFGRTKRFPFIFFFARFRFVHVVVVVMLQHITFHIHTIDKTLSVAILSVKRDFRFLDVHTRTGVKQTKEKSRKKIPSNGEEKNCWIVRFARFLFVYECACVCPFFRQFTTYYYVVPFRLFSGGCLIKSEAKIGRLFE